MDMYTITAARLVGAPQGKLSHAIRTGHLRPAPAQAPTVALTVTVAALQAAGFAVPAAALPHRPAAPDTSPALEAAEAPAPEAPLPPAAELSPPPL